jgi:Tfp pilus assembly protein FimV
MIAKQIENLVKATAMTPPPPPRSRTTSTPPPEETADANVPSKGYEYEVKQGDTLGRIVKAYRDKGVKVSFSQIKAANPKMNPDVLIPGKKIFIPDANAK